MSSWQGKSKGKPLGYRIFVFILKVGGVSPAYFLLRFVTFYYLLFSYRSTKYILSYFRERHKYSFLRALYKAYQNYNYLGEAIIDKVVVISGIPNKLTFEFDGIENLKKIAAQKKGGLLLSAHIGNWEAASHLLKDIDARINIVTFDGEDAGIKEYMESVTGKSMVNFIYIRDDMSHIFEINEAFSNSELVCMPADRFIPGNKTVTVNFLGANAKFPIGPFMLAHKFNVPVSFVLAVKESTFHYHFFASDIKEYLYLERDVAVNQMLTDFAGYMEEKVKKYPEQWFNYYKFWD